MIIAFCFAYGDELPPTREKAAVPGGGCLDILAAENIASRKHLCARQFTFGTEGVIYESCISMSRWARPVAISHHGRGDWAKRTAGKAAKQVPPMEFKDLPVVRRLKAQGDLATIGSAY